MKYRIDPPPNGLQAYFLSSLLIDIKLDQVLYPVSLSPCFTILIEGQAFLHQNGQNILLPSYGFAKPRLRPQMIHYSGQVKAFILCVKPGLWPEISNHDLQQFEGDFLPLERIFNPQKVQELQTALQHIQRSRPTSGQTSLEQDYLDLIHSFLLSQIQTKSVFNLGTAFLASQQKLFLPMLHLAHSLGLGERQLERRIKQHFSFNLRDLRRISRLGFCLLRILKDHSKWGDLTQIALDSGYYDQAHMYKDFTDFIGITPSQFLQALACRDMKFWFYHMQADDFQEVFYALT